MLNVYIDRPRNVRGREKAREAIGGNPISVIIPVLNEERVLGQTLRRLQSASQLEIIVVDGGSSDGSLGVAAAHGAGTLSTARGRARQMNAGAALATSPILLFLHADTLLPEGFDQGMRDALQRPGVVAGAFELGIASRHWCYRIVERGANLRARCLQMPYGDQGLFLRADLFYRLGGFPELPIMEDFELVRRVRRHGRLAIVAARATTSARRWERIGLWRTTWLNQLVLLGYYLGVAPERLAAWYAGRGGGGEAHRRGEGER